jgi:hypothetical protein
VGKIFRRFVCKQDVLRLCIFHHFIHSRGSSSLINSDNVENLTAATIVNVRLQATVVIVRLQVRSDERRTSKTGHKTLQSMPTS